MNYNDFPILSNDEYNLLNEHFNINQPKDKPTVLNNLLEKLNICFSFCIGLTNKYNVKINIAINNTKNQIEKIKNNLTATFNLTSTKNNSVLNSNIFILLNTIIEAVHETIIWTTIENKEYYKTLAQKNLNDLISCVKEILLALEKSNILFFKHM